MARHKMDEKTKDRIKDVVGRPKWWLINGVAIALLITALALWNDRADAASPRTSPSVSARAERVPMCGTYDVVCKRVNQFKRDRLGNAKGIRFPRHMKKRITRKMIAKGFYARSASGDDDWWRDPLRITQCLVTSTAYQHRGTCDEGQKSVNRLAADTHRIYVWCGGAAVIGALGAKGNAGYWGAGRGAAACLWTKFMGMW